MTSTQFSHIHIRKKVPRKIIKKPKTMKELYDLDRIRYLRYSKVVIYPH